MTNSWLTQVEELRLGQSEDWVSARRLSPAASRARGGGRGDVGLGGDTRHRPGHRSSREIESEAEARQQTEMRRMFCNLQSVSLLLSGGETS